MKKVDNFDPSKWLVENKITTQSRLNEVNQPYKVISKETEKSQFEDEVYDDYSLELNNETHTTPDGLTFYLKTVGYISIPEGEELNIGAPGHYYYYVQTYVFDENGKELEQIPGEKKYGTYDRAASINKAKKWLNQRGSQLMAGKGFQHKST